MYFVYFENNCILKEIFYWIYLSVCICIVIVILYSVDEYCFYDIKVEGEEKFYGYSGILIFLYNIFLIENGNGNGYFG